MKDKNNIISVKNISVSFDCEEILKDFSLDVKNGEFITLLGPSGCGKTTLLRVIGGFVTQDSGDIMFNNKVINDVPSYKREVNTIFQKYALFPHLNVFENVAFGMKVHKKSNSDINKRVKELLEMINLKGYSKRRVHELSGGQQQRIAIARALANEPKTLLLDEPLGALDLKLRKDMQIELKDIQERTGITFIFVTHDQEEALSMSDRVVVMNKGEIQQIGTPEDIYNEPENAFVADFIGESNIIDGAMIRDFLVKFSGINFNCVDKGFKPMESVDVVIRPEDIQVCKPSQNSINGQVTSVTFKGVHYEIIVDVAGFKWMIQSTIAQKVGDRIGMFLSPDDIHIMKKSKYSGEYGDYSAFSDEFYDEQHFNENHDQDMMENEV